MLLDENTVATILNQIFDIEKKVKNQSPERTVGRNLKRLKSIFESRGYLYHDPLGEKYNLTRLDCEAMVAGEKTDNLVIVEVVKPIVYHKQDQHLRIIQKGVVITEE